MQERPRRRRSRSRRPREQVRPTEPAAARSKRPEPERRPARPAPRRRPDRFRVDEIRPGSPCVILLDAREGEPDRSGATASFEGFFDFESGEPRRSQSGIPRLRVGDDRLWGFECWWRPDPQRTGFTADDRERLETSKRLLRGLMRDARRGGLRGALPART